MLLFMSRKFYRMQFVMFELIALQSTYRNYVDTGVLVDGIFEVTVLVGLIVAVVIAYTQTSKLDINHHPIR